MAKSTTKITKLAKITRFVDDDTKKTIQHLYVTPNISGATSSKTNHHINPQRKYRCMWCTLELLDGVNPIGCPIDTITKYTNCKNSDQQESLEFITFGIFCSFNCARAYSDDKCHDYKFRNSARLLALMYRQLNKGCDGGPITIKPAPSISLMQSYGGDMTDDQYRSSFDKFVYEEKGILKQFPVTIVFEENESI